MQSSSTSSRQTIYFILAGVFALIVVHGLGRFAFTPLLPYLVQDKVINLEQGAFLATLNYFGYLIGAVSAVFLTRVHLLKKCLFSSLIINFVSTTLQIFTIDIDLFSALRFINGLTNGIVFVLAPALILEWLVEHKKSHLSGLVYLGVSIGLILDSVLVDWLNLLFSSQLRWIPIAAIAFPLTLFSLFYFNKISIHPLNATLSSQQKLLDYRTIPLLIAYAGAGLGYILPMTFLPALAHQIIPENTFLITNTWLITAISCLIFLPLWNKLGAKTNDRFALIISYIIQAISLVFLILFANATGIILCAILMGGSFMGTVICSQRLAKFFLPDLGAKLYATLISIYAGTQLIGPYLAKIYIAHGGTLLDSFWFGLFALIWGIIWMLKVPKPNV